MALHLRTGRSRFLQTDPVPGGSANAYDYAGQDPVNSYDLDGRICWSCAWHHVSHTLGEAEYQVNRAAAYVSYGVYYGGYRMNKWAARGNRRSVGYAAKQPLRYFGWLMQADGIAGDAYVDVRKRSSCCPHESVFDEHRRGSSNPFHTPRAPKDTYLPGLYYKHGRPGLGQARLDWAW